MKVARDLFTGRWLKRSRQETLRQFFAELDRTTQSGCWLCSATFVSGYARIVIDGKLQRAHRVIWEEVNGPIPVLKKLLHKCPGGSHRNCVNPEHLYVGTDKQNAKDRDAEGRTYRGVVHLWTKLTEALVVSIRLRAAAGERQIDISKSTGVKPKNVQAIVRRKTWKHV